MGVNSSLLGRRVLDIGCSDGGHAFACAARGAEVVGIDAEDSPRNEGRNNFAENRRLLGLDVDYRAAPIAEVTHEFAGAFDVVLFLNVLYHMRDPAQGLRDVSAVVAPGGTLYVKTLIYSPLPSRVQPLLGGRPGPSLWRRPRCYSAGRYGADDRTLFCRPNWWFVPAHLEKNGLAVERVRRRGDRQFVVARRPGGGASG